MRSFFQKRHFNRNLSKNNDDLSGIYVTMEDGPLVREKLDLSAKDPLFGFGGDNPNTHLATLRTICYSNKENLKRYIDDSLSEEVRKAALVDLIGRMSEAVGKGYSGFEWYESKHIELHKNLLSNHSAGRKPPPELLKHISKKLKSLRLDNRFVITLSQNRVVVALKNYRGKDYRVYGCRYWMPIEESNDYIKDNLY